MDFDLLIQRKRERFEQLEREIADPSLFENRNRAGEIMREHANVKALLAKWTELSNARMQLADNRELANSSDTDLAQMAQEEIPANERCRSRCFRQTKMKIETRSSRFAPAPAEARPQFSRLICIGCTITMPSQP